MPGMLNPHRRSMPAACDRGCEGSYPVQLASKQEERRPLPYVNTVRRYPPAQSDRLQFPSASQEQQDPRSCEAAEYLKVKVRTVLLWARQGKVKAYPLSGTTMKKRVRQQFGSVVFDKRIKTWNFLWWENGKRRSKTIGSVRQFPTKASAWRAAMALRQMIESATGTSRSNAPTVRTLVEKYRAEKMPSRSDTRRSYEVWLRNHIVPKWGNCALSDVQARPVELWLESLTLAPKSKAHIRGLLSILWDFAMWSGDLPMQRNPMEIVRVKGATRRARQPRSLTVDEFQKFWSRLKEPFATVALLCCCLGLRISECLGLKWCDVDWLNSTLRVERGIVSQCVDEVKTTESRKRMAIDRELLEVLKRWKQATQFSALEHWMFASPMQLGRLPWSYD